MQHELGEARPQRAQRALDDPVVLPGAGRLLVLLLGDPEEDHRLDAERGRAPRPRARRRRRVKRDMPGSSLVRERSGATKSGITNWSSASRVSRTRPRSGRAAEAAEPDVGEASSCRKSTSGGEAAMPAGPQSTAPIPRSQTVSIPASATGSCRRGRRRTTGRRGRRAGSGSPTTRPRARRAARARGRRPAGRRAPRAATPSAPHARARRAALPRRRRRPPRAATPTSSSGSRAHGSPP